MGSLDLQLLGSFEVRVGLALPTLESVRGQALITYLALHRGAAVPRERLAGLLWPGSGAAQARTNLRHLVHTLRRAWPVGSARLEVTPTALRWRDDPGTRVDVTVFEALLEHRGRSRAEALREAVALYRGDLVEGLDDPWLVEERDRLRSRLAAALTELADTSVADDGGAAVAYAERLLRLDPLHEPTYRLLMRLHADQGNQALALRTYHRCAAVLERELGVPPAPRRGRRTRRCCPRPARDRTRRGGATVRRWSVVSGSGPGWAPRGGRPGRGTVSSSC